MFIELYLGHNWRIANEWAPRFTPSPRRGEGGVRGYDDSVSRRRSPLIPPFSPTGRRSERRCVPNAIEISRKANGSLRGGLGRLRALAAILLLDDAGRFAAQAPQIIELGAPHLAAPHHLDRIDQRRIEREDALDAFAIGNLAHREVLVEARSG